MEKPVIQQQLAQKVGICLLLGSLGWVLLLAKGAVVLRGQAGSTTYDVLFGPFILNRISKREIEDGFVASFSFESGIWWYALCWLLLGLLFGVVSTHISGSKQEL
jgi:hypothetical protein